MPLPRCFFDVSINSIPSGRIVFELFQDDCPKTVENFRCLCTGEKGVGRTTFKPLHYKGTPIHRIVKGFIIQGGDFSNGDGTGGESIYGGMFKDECFKHKHDQPFLLSMANKGPHTNGSQFFITTRPAPHLDSIHVIFGRVIDGFQFVTEMENQKVDGSHRPYADVRITHCAELVLLKKSKSKRPPAAVVSSSGSSEDDSTSASSSDSDSEVSTDSEEERRRRRRRRRKKRRRKRKERLLLKKKGLLKEGRLSREERRKKRRSLKLAKKKAALSQKKEEREPDRKALMRDSMEKKVESSTSGSEMSQSEEDEPVTSTVPELTGEREQDIPTMFKTDRSSWLYRRSRSRSPMAEEAGERKKGRVVTTRQQAPGYKPLLVTRKNEVSESGRKLKGRGQMRYRTPPRYGGEDDLRFELESGATSIRQSSFGSDRRKSRFLSSDYQRRSRSRSRSQDRTRSDDHKRRFDDSSSWQRRHGRYDRDREGGSRGRRFPRRWDSPPGEGTRDRHAEEQGQRERSQSPGSKGRGQRRDWRSGSNSPSRRRRRRSRFDQGPESDDARRRRGQGGDEGALQSKWARHRDNASADVSSSEEETDKQLELTYQEKQMKLAEEQDVFGLDKIL